MTKLEVVVFVLSIYLLVLLVSSHIVIEAAQKKQQQHVVSSSGENGVSSSTSIITRLRSKTNPFTPKAYVIRYWNNKISNKLLRKPPSFLLSKASPLTSVELAFFTNLLSSNHNNSSNSNSLSSHLPAFCASANLFCNMNNHNRPIKPQQPVDANFTSYTASKSFTTYGRGSSATHHGSTDSFANYSVGVNMPTNTFTHYSPSSSSSPHSDRFSTYSDDANVGNDRFSAYAAANANPISTNSSSSSGSSSSTFTRYETNVNVPDLTFTSYNSRASRHNLSFTSYTENANSGREAFVSYGKNSASESPAEFSSYGESSNILRSTFTGYGEAGRGPANDSFKGYGGDANNPSNDFKGYGVNVGGGNKNGGVNRFANYRDGANVGEDSFQGYGEAVGSRFVNYGRSLNNGSDTFKGYGKGEAGIKRDVGFRTYAGVNNTFKGYGDDKKGITFAGYRGNTSTATTTSGRSMWVEEGRFFRESMLRRGTVMKMPDIRDKMPKRSFLPRGILWKLPPMTRSGVEDITAVFGSGTEGAVSGTVEECERAASRGERKRCVGSVEDMIDFAVEELGRDVVVRTTEGVGGAGEDVVIGQVRGGMVGRSVSCHQSLFPYLVYYCHSVPKVRVYEAEIMSSTTTTVEGKRPRVNKGIAVCHLDTSDWSAGHGAFVALGYGPGIIEVCHWIYENDMTWTSVGP